MIAIRGALTARSLRNPCSRADPRLPCMFSCTWMAHNSCSIYVLAYGTTTRPCHIRTRRTGRGGAYAFGLATREEDGDWRDYMEQLVAPDEGPPVKLRTEVTEEFPRTILSFNQSPDVPFDRSVNAYRGCEHGCVYCFARPACLSRSLARARFRNAACSRSPMRRNCCAPLAKRKYRPRPLAMGTNTDPYQPIEARYRITRQVLEVCLDARHPVTITTKSDRVLDDLDLLAELAERGWWRWRSRSRRSTRNCRASSNRARRPLPSGCRRWENWPMRACRRIARSPIIPAITDEFMEEIVQRAAAQSGVDSCRLDPAAPAARGRPAVPRMAVGPLSRARRQGDEHRPVDPQRQGQRSRTSSTPA